MKGLFAEAELLPDSKRALPMPAHKIVRRRHQPFQLCHQRSHRTQPTKPAAPLKAGSAGSRKFCFFQLRAPGSRIEFIFMKVRVWVGLLVIVIFALGCRNVYYSAWEKFGVYKRDLLKKRVQSARDEEKAAAEQFKDALTRIKEKYGFQGGALEKTYNTLKAEYDRSIERADAVHKRVKEVQTA